jgi:hypothetical protein
MRWMPTSVQWVGRCLVPNTSCKEWHACLAANSCSGHFVLMHLWHSAIHSKCIRYSQNLPESVLSPNLFLWFQTFGTVEVWLPTLEVNSCSLFLVPEARVGEKNFWMPPIRGTKMSYKIKYMPLIFSVYFACSVDRWKLECSKTRTKPKLQARKGGWYKCSQYPACDRWYRTEHSTKCHHNPLGSK